MSSGKHNLSSYATRLRTASHLFSNTGKMSTDSVPGFSPDKVRASPKNGEVENFCARLRAVLHVFVQSEAVLDSFEDQVYCYLNLEVVGFMRRAKLFCVFFRAEYLGERDGTDYEGLRFSGAFRRWMRSRLRFTEKNTSLWSAFFLMKNCARPAPQEIVKDALVDHALAVQKPDTAEREDVERAVQALEPTLQQLDQLIGPLRDEEWFLDRTCEIPVPMTASYSSPQSAGGLAGEVYSYMRGAPLPYESDLTLEESRERLEYLDWAANDGLEQAREEFEDHPRVSFGLTHPFEKMWRPKVPTFDPDNPLDVQLLRGQATRVRVVEGRCDWCGWQLSAGERVPGDGFCPSCSIPTCATELPRRWAWQSSLRVGDSWWEGSTLVKIEPKSVCNQSVRRQLERHADWLSRDSPAWCTLDYHTYAQHVTEVQESALEHAEVVTDGREYEYVIGESYPVMRAKYRSLVKWCLRRCEYQLYLRQPWTARVVAVTEPLKVRVITVDPMPVSLVTSLWQKVVHGAMRQIPAFRLLGQSPRASDLETLWTEAEGRDGWGSSDFSGASNGTPALLRDALNARISQGKPGWFRVAGLTGNSPAKLVYPFAVAVKLLALTGRPYALQVRGTLMGRKTSFPILSLEVAAAHLLARGDGDLRGVLINGDDRLAMTSRPFEGRFWLECGRLQFGRSKGKSYFHPTYANINSQSYHVVDGVARFIPVLKCGLLVGQKKLDEVFDPCTVVTTLLDSCKTTTMEHRVMRVFLTLHKPLLRVKLGGRSLYASTSVGGMGQRRPGWSGRFGYWKWSYGQSDVWARRYADAVVSVGRVRAFDYRYDLTKPDWSYSKDPLDPVGRPDPWKWNKPCTEYDLSIFTLFDRAGIRPEIRAYMESAATVKLPQSLFRNGRWVPDALQLAPEVDVPEIRERIQELDILPNVGGGRGGLPPELYEEMLEATAGTLDDAEVFDCRSLSTAPWSRVRITLRIEDLTVVSTTAKRLCATCLTHLASNEWRCVCCGDVRKPKWLMSELLGRVLGDDPNRSVAT